MEFVNTKLNIANITSATTHFDKKLSLVSKTDLEKFLISCKARVESFLEHVMPSAQSKPEILHQAMRYTVFNGGKRLRSALLYAIGTTTMAHPMALNYCAAAIEILHAASLIHDDLPALDNDELRRGKPTCHIQYDEATAILAGDALIMLSFEILTKIQNFIDSPEINLRMIRMFSHLAGSKGMTGGEYLDIATKNMLLELKDLELIYKLKTSYLLSAGIVLAALAGNCTQAKVLLKLEKFGFYTGVAFQIHDDILGETSSSKELGKVAQSDRKNNKPTFPQLFGLKKSIQLKKHYLKLGLENLEKSGFKYPLITELVNFCIKRTS